MVPMAKSSIATPDTENKTTSKITGDNSESVVRFMDKKKSNAFSIKRSPSTQPNKRNDLFELVGTL